MNTTPNDSPAHTSENTQQPKIIYQHNGYQIRIHFDGTKTLAQCMKNLAERKLLN